MLRENKLVAPFGEFSEFCTGYLYYSDRYHFGIIFISRVPIFMVFNIFRNSGRIRRLLCLPGFRIIFPIGVLIPYFGDLCVLLFNG